MQFKHLQHRFVQHIPDKIELGVLYISMEYGTAAHSCCCGCGEEVVTPFTPTDWRMIFDGETVSLNPSIGNWTLACRSHYVIKRGRVIEAEPWTDEQISSERRRDRASKKAYFGTSNSIRTVPHSQSKSAKISDRASLWARFRRHVFNR